MSHNFKVGQIWSVVDLGVRIVYVLDSDIRFEFIRNPSKLGSFAISPDWARHWDMTLIEDVP